MKNNHIIKFERASYSHPDDTLALKNIVMRNFKQMQKRGYFHDFPDFVMRLVLDETIDNAMIHGNCGNPKKLISLSISYYEQSILITVTDEGLGFRPEKIPDPKKRRYQKRLNGRGIYLLKTIGNVTWNKNGNSISVELTSENEFLAAGIAQ